MFPLLLYVFYLFGLLGLAFLLASGIVALIASRWRDAPPDSPVAHVAVAAATPAGSLVGLAIAIAAVVNADGAPPIGTTPPVVGLATLAFGVLPFATMATFAFAAVAREAAKPPGQSQAPSWLARAGVLAARYGALLAFVQVEAIGCFIVASARTP